MILEEELGKRSSQHHFILRNLQYLNSIDYCLVKLRESVVERKITNSLI